MENLLWIILSPLAGFAISGLAGKYLPKGTTGWIASLAVLVSFVLSFSLFNGLLSNPAAIKKEYFTFIGSGNFHVNFALSVDRLTAMMMLIVTGIGFLIHVYSISYMHSDEGFYKFFAFLNLFIFNMLILIMGSNFLMLFFGWEGVGLCSYLLIGFWYQNEAYGKAARKAFVMNRIGDLGLLIGIFLIAWQFGSLDYDKVLDPAKLVAIAPGMITAICVLLFIGAMGKSAQIPLYTWLPDAMAGPTPVSALIHAATMVTAGIYLVVRTHVLFDMSVFAREFVLIIGLCTSILAALIGLKQNDIKKVLAYSTVSQLGFMFIALGSQAYVAAMFHLTTHAFFKALLFLGSGSVIHALDGEQDIRKMGGLRKAMPITFWTFLLGTLAICGFPYFSGFFSKDEILAEVYKHNVVLWALCVGSAGLTCIYMLRVLIVTFWGTFRGSEEQKHHLHESPALITIPLVILAVLSVFGGILNLPPLLSDSIAHGMHHFLSPALNLAEVPEELSPLSQLNLVVVTVVVLALAFWYVRHKYIAKQVVPETDDAMSGMGKVMANKFYVDEIFDASLVEPIEKTSDFTYKWLDRKWIDGLVNSFGKIANAMSNLYGKMQNGNLEYYLLYMVAGIILIVGYNLMK
ncbi:MAG: NADH-quinone oxidoreductase subunit L [Bacteroidetes bacterium]|nr:NADH-quinone oxidoreductase subunit L [Bacteroidota bacterium]